MYGKLWLIVARIRLRNKLILIRGTQITLYLREDDKYEYSEPSKIHSLVKNYSQFVSFPIYTWQEKSRCRIRLFRMILNFEVAEALFDLMKQSQSPNNNSKRLLRNL